MITDSLVKVNVAPPYVPEPKAQVLINSMALDLKTGSDDEASRRCVQCSCGGRDVCNLLNLGSLAIGVGVEQGKSRLF